MSDPSPEKLAPSHRANGARRAAVAVLVAAVALALGGCGGDEQREPPPPVGSIARQLAKAGAGSVIVLVSDGGREHTATAGTPRPGRDQRFRIGSVTKTFTATIVLQLVAEGRLRLEDTLEQHVPDIGADERITIRQLLQHRSGLANVTDFPSWLEVASRSASTRPVDILRFATSKPLVFPPGSRWGYSNTNYIALGLVIEKVTGQTYRRELERRLLEPLDLESTELPRARRLDDLDDRGENPDVPWAAGALVSSTHDLARFFAALLSGRVLSEESLALMKQTVAVDPGRLASGLGIFSTDLPCGRFWGHGGSILDYVTTVQASESGDRVAVVSLRVGGMTGAPPDEATLLCAAPRSPG